MAMFEVHLILSNFTKRDSREFLVTDTIGKLYQEVYSPQFHFTAKKNWLNDPNGVFDMPPSTTSFSVWENLPHLSHFRAKSSWKSCLTKTLS